MKWVGRVLYVVFVGLMSYVVIALLTIPSTYFTYHKDKMKEYEDGERDKAFLDDYVISFYANIQPIHDQSYHKIEPLYSYKNQVINDLLPGEDKVEFSIDLAIYKGTYYDSKNPNNNPYDFFVVLIKDVIYNYSKDPADPQIVKNGAITVYLELSEDIVDPSGKTDPTYQVTQSLSGSNDGYYVIFYHPIALEKANGDFIDIKLIDVSYPVSQGDTKMEKFLSLVNKDYEPTIDVFEKNNDLRRFEINKTNIFLSKEVTYDQALDDGGINYYLQVIDYSDYNWIIVRNVSILVVVVLAFTYLLFFHKQVMEIVAVKKENKRQLVIDTTVTETPKDRAQIFTDDEEYKTNK